MEQFDVVVVGAGLAGLRAAHVLRSAGASVVVLEANSRVGGRVWTHRFANGQWCERGAEFVDTHHAEVLGLVSRFGLELADSGGSLDPVKRRLDIAGRVTAFDEQPSMLADIERWDAAKAELAASIDIGDLGNGRAIELDGMTAAQFVNGLGLSIYARVVVGRELRTEFMVPPDELSLLHLAWIAALDRQAGDGREAYRLAGGLDQLATCLAADLDDLGVRAKPDGSGVPVPGIEAGGSDCVRLSTVVTAVDSSTGVVTTSSGRRFVGSSVILAVPPSVLSRINITPALPAVLTSIGWGIGAKVSRQYARRTWLDAGGDGSVISERAYGELWEATYGQPGDAGVLTALLSSNDGAALGALPDVVSRVGGEVARIFPGSATMEGESIVTNWTNEPFALGCYSAFAPGQITTIWPLFQHRYARVILAGEHTDPFAGFMEGALRSGVRAANAILKSST